jgi:hypothetical protein
MAIGEQLLANFARIAASDGGALSLLEETESLIRLAYRSGGEADCDDGVCALPQSELEAMMLAWLARKAPDVTLEIERLPA